MIIKLHEGCYGPSVSVNGADLLQHTQDSIEVNSEVQANAIKYITDKLKGNPSLITNIVADLITIDGDVKDKGYCDQCGTNEEEYSEEFEVVPKIGVELSYWTTLNKLHPPNEQLESLAKLCTKDSFRCPEQSLTQDDLGIRLTHTPTGITVDVSDHRSYLLNYQTALVRMYYLLENKTK